MGRMIHADGGRYYGQWLLDKKNGKGRYTYPNGVHSVVGSIGWGGVAAVERAAVRYDMIAFLPPSSSCSVALALAVELALAPY